MLNQATSIAAFDEKLWAAMAAEAARQENHIELIASENYASPLVMAAQGSLLTNKYAEGYPGKRYYGGCEFVDEVERLAIERAKRLFKADYVNVQPHSGSQANAAVMMALLSPGDTILGMALSHGGHLTHGSKVNFSGQLYNSVSYGVNVETGLIDYDELAAFAKTQQPKLIIGGFSAYSQIIDWAKLREIADSVNAYLMADVAHVAGLIAADCYPSPLPYAHVVTSTTHKTLRGPRGGLIFAGSDPLLEKKLNSAVFPGTQGGPFMHVIAAKALAFEEALQPEFKTYQQQVLKNAKKMAALLQAAGFDIVSGGTENHLILLNLINKSLTGKEADEALGLAHITVNKNAVPNDPLSPFVTSGLRLGTPAITTRGFKEAEVTLLTEAIIDILNAPKDLGCREVVKEKILDLCQRFPVYEKLSFTPSFSL